MDQRLITAYEILKANTSLLNRVKSELKAEDITKRIVENTNPFIQIFGHITNYRFEMANRIGIPEAFRWEEKFRRGSKLQNEYPPLESIYKDFENISARLFARLEQLDETVLTSRVKFNNPFRGDSVLGMISFIVFHETYHVGQISFLYKAFLNEGMVD